MTNLYRTFKNLKLPSFISSDMIIRLLRLCFSGSWVNFYGNIGKLLLSLVCTSVSLLYEILLMNMISHSLTILQVSIFFDILFMIQHYVLYPERKRKSETAIEYDNAAKSSDQTLSQNV